MTSQDLDVQRHAAAIASGGISDDAIHRVFVRLADDLGLAGDLLDFGAGTGGLVRRLAASGRFSSATAVDLVRYEAAAEAGTAFVERDLNEPTGLPAESFDVVVSSEVIEHLENPRAVAREWFRLLRSGGTLIFSTPNNESWRSLASLALRGHFVSFADTCYPAHITALVRKDIERILVEAGFSLPRFSFTNVGGIPKLPRLKWQTVSAGLLRGLRFSDNLIAMSRKP